MEKLSNGGSGSVRYLFVWGTDQSEEASLGAKTILKVSLSQCPHLFLSTITSQSFYF